MTQYFIHDGQNEKGPLSIEQLRLETLKKETPVWFEGLENWTTIGQVEELKSLFISKSTPPLLKDALNDVKQKVTQQDQQLTQQDQLLTQQNQQLTQQQEEQKQAEDQQLQAEKDRINGQLAEKYTGYRNSWRNV